MKEDFSKYNGEGTTLRKAQRRLLEMLVEVDRICKKHNIPYWINGGNALGAVRHGGFIPWDDDIDIALLRKDYLKLLQVIENELPENYMLQNRSNEPYFYMVYSRVVDKNSLSDYGTNRASFRKKMKHQGLFLDIFYIEKGHPKIKNIIDSLYYPAFFHLSPYSSFFKRLIAKIIWPFTKFLVFFTRKMNFSFSNDLYVFGYGIPFKEHFRLNELFPVKPINYEGKSVLGPNNIHAYLKRYFGENYMEIPSVEQRKTHAQKIEVYDAK